MGRTPLQLHRVISYVCNDCVSDTEATLDVNKKQHSKRVRFEEELAVSLAS